MTPTPPSTVIAGQAKMLEQIMEGYEEPLVDADPDLRSRRRKCVQVVMRQAVKRTWDHLANTAEAASQTIAADTLPQVIQRHRGSVCGSDRICKERPALL